MSALLGAAVALMLAVTVFVVWVIYDLLPLPLFIADLVLAAPLAFWWNVRAYRAKGYPLPWDRKARR